jgi:pimeloyl-ACP methyl ester carboxylesterase
MIRLAGGDAGTAALQAELQSKIFEAVRDSSADSDLPAKIRSIIQETIASMPDDQRDAFAMTESQIEAQVQMTTTPWFRQILRIDPSETLKQVRCPVLAVNGEKDIQVASKENLSAIQRALKAGGNQDVTVIEFPGLNHLFQTCETGATHEYASIEETFNEEALAVITNWIRKRVGL